MLTNAISTKVPPPYDDVVLAHLLVLQHYYNGAVDEAYARQAALVSDFLRIFADRDRYSLPILYALNRDVRILATKVRAGRKAGRRGRDAGLAIPGWVLGTLCDPAGGRQGGCGRAEADQAGGRGARAEPLLQRLRHGPVRSFGDAAA